MAETEVNRDDMVDVIGTLKHHFAHDPNVYVSGNLLLYYEEGNPRKHVSPDVLVSFEVPREPKRDYYLVWKEGKGDFSLITTAGPPSSNAVNDFFRRRQTE